jgi:hypothetical protein
MSEGAEKEHQQIKEDDLVGEVFVKKDLVAEQSNFIHGIFE